MQEQYNPQEIEPKVQSHWEQNNSFKVVEDESKEKYYCLSMFPYQVVVCTWVTFVTTPSVMWSRVSNDSRAKM